jgi:hypothetical protein
MKVDKVSKGRGKGFAAGGKRAALGKGDRTKTAFPASPQRPGRTGQHSTKSTARRASGTKVRSAAVDEAGATGGSRAANPRRPAA